MKSVKSHKINEISLKSFEISEIILKHSDLEIRYPFYPFWELVTPCIYHYMVEVKKVTVATHRTTVIRRNNYDCSTILLRFSYSCNYIYLP